MRSFVGLRRIVAIASALLCVMPGALVAAADAPRLVVDIQPGAGSDPGGFVELDGTVYFAATDPAHGREPWRTDGTPEGTSLVADVRPEHADSDPSLPVAYRDGVVFNAYDDQGPAIWRVGGDVEGAVQVARDVWLLAVSGDRILATQSRSSGLRLVELDPTSGATNPVGDLGRNADAIYDWLDVDGTLYFTVDRGGQARTELWATDGTDEGTRSLGRIGTSGAKLTDVWPVEHMDQFTAFGSKLWFVRHWSGRAGCEDSGDLWTSDGTTGGTRRAAEVLGRIGPCIADVTRVGDHLFFTSRRSSDGSAELWTTDGTKAGTSMLATFQRHWPERLTPLGDTDLVFEAGDGDQQGLWSSDGTSAGTRFVGPFLDEPFSGLEPDTERAYVARGDELWVTDGTADGTGLIVAFQPRSARSEISGLTRLGSSVVFAADDGSAGLEPWVSDGTPAGTLMLRDIDPTDLGSDPGPLTAADVLYLSARGVPPAAQGAPRLWAIRPSLDENGSRTTSVAYETEAAEPTWITALGSRVVFAARHPGGSHGVELWSADEGSSTELKDIRPGQEGSDPSDLAVMGGRVYFAATSGTGRDLWATDGTTEGTVLVRDLAATKGGAPRDLVVAGDRLFFTSGDKAHGRELWTSDGTARGTRLVADIRPGTRTSGIVELTAVGDSVFFRADDGVHDAELWTSDGTLAGTRLVRELDPTAGSLPRGLTEAGGVLYFIATDLEAIDGSRLWSTDGTAEGTTPIAPPVGCDETGGLDPPNLAGYQGTLYFGAICGSGQELFRVDSAADVAVQVADVNPNGDSDPIVLGGVFGRLYFSADDGVHGRELWRTDGTPGGTELVGDIDRGGSSDPAAVVPFSRAVYFTADDGVHGREVWSVAP
jgi:ELWxxDGT repeat protein